MHPKACKTFKALGMMLCYPHKDWVGGAKELSQIVADEGLIKDSNDLQQFQKFAARLQERDTLDSQEEYVETFDRNKSLSLHLFEHIHGESRDRGQAMVDLKEIYQESGYELDNHELPDYLPVFLEHLSYLPQDEATEMLKEPIKILKALGKRLAERGSDYAVIFNLLLKIAGEEVEEVKKRKVVEASYEQLDKEWEENPITFLGSEAPTSKAGGCGGCGGGGSGGGCHSSKSCN